MMCDQLDRAVTQLLPSNV